MDSASIPSPKTGRGSCLLTTLCIVGWAIVFLGAGLGGLIYYTHTRERDDPQRVYEHHTQELDRYAKRLVDGQVKVVDGEYAVPQFLIDLGVTHVRKQQNCFVITFECMVTDPVPQLWFSPDGFRPLPDPLVELYRGNAYFRFLKVSENWGTCEWDQ